MSNESLSSVGKVRKTATLDNSLFREIAEAKEKRKNNPSTAKVKPPFDAKRSELNQVMESIATRVKDNRQMMDLLPDLELAKRLVVASILSPKDLIRTELTYQVTHDNEDVVSAVTELISDHFTNRVKLNAKLTEILGDSLFDHGAYIMAVIPEESLVGLNNASLDAKVQPGKKLHAAMESLYSSLSKHTAPAGFISGDRFAVSDMTITDDFRLLGMPTIVGRKLRSESYRKIMGSVSMEAEKYLTVPDSFATPNGIGGTALTFRLGIESTIPIHVPGDPSDHLGYLVLTDKNYRPIASASDTGEAATSIKEKLKAAIKDNDSPVANAWNGITEESARKNKKLSADAFIETYEAHIYQEIDKALDVDTSKGVQVSRPDYVMRLMLQRLLAREKTNIMYLPKEAVSYFAFDHDDFGIGKSLLEATKVFGSIRVLLVFTELLNTIRAAIPNTKLRIRLAENDQDKKATVDNAIQEFLDYNSQEVNLNSFYPSDILRHVSKLGVQVEIENAETFISTKVDVERTNSQVTQIDTSFSEKLRRSQYAGLGFQPEIIDSLMAGELATVFASRNALNSKSIMERQQSFESMLSDHVRRVTFMTSGLIKAIYDIVEEKLGDKLSRLEKEEHESSATVKVKDDMSAEQSEKGSAANIEPKEVEVTSDSVKASETSIKIHEMVYEIIDSISVTLPDPDLSAIRATQESFQEYSTLVDQLVEAYLTEDMEEMLRDYGIDRIDSARHMMAGALKRKWLREQNVLPEIYDFFDDTKEHTKFISDHMANIVKSAKALQKKRARLSAKEEVDSAEGVGADDTASGAGAAAPTESTDNTADGGENFGDFNF